MYENESSYFFKDCSDQIMDDTAFSQARVPPSNDTAGNSVFFLVVHDLDCSDQIMDDAAFLQARVPRQITLQHDTT